MPPVVPELEARGLGETAAGELVQADDRRVALELAGRGRDGAQAAAVAAEALDAGAEPQRHAALDQRLVDGLGDVGVEHLGEHPRSLVDEVDGQPAVAEVAGHLDAERARADHHDALHVVEQLVELHRGADVLDVVQPLEVRAGHVRLLPHEPGADDQLVEPLVRVARGDRPAVEVDVRDGGLHAHVEAVLDVALDRGEEEVLELRDLAAVHERDAAGRVGDVRELREQRHLEIRCQSLRDGRGCGSGAATADHDETLGHETSRRVEPSPDVVRYSTAGGVASVLETQHSRRARAGEAGELLVRAVRRRRDHDAGVAELALGALRAHVHPQPGQLERRAGGRRARCARQKQLASAAHRSSVGMKPSSLPPADAGSSTATVWPRPSTVAAYPPRQVAVTSSGAHRARLRAARSRRS